MQTAPLPAGFTAHNDRETLEVAVCGDALVHVTSRPVGAPAAAEAQPWMLAKADTCPGAPFQFSQANGVSTLTTARLTVSLTDRDGNLTFKTVEGETLVRERNNLPRTYLASQAAGLYHIEDRFGPDATEALYGLGQHQSGMFNYRGSVVELGQNNTDIAIPLLVSSKGYAILWNTASFSYVDNRFPLELNLESMAAPQIDYYVLYGPQMDAILHLYRSMTGHAPLFPEWAYGFFQSKDRYKTQSEILSIAAEYRARHIPMDAIVQDWFWWKEGRKGDPIFNSGYTDVPAELKTLHDEHVHAMISAWAMMDATAENFKQIVAKGFDVPGAQIYDPSNPGAADFFWNQFVGKLFAQGWDAFWLDSSEPEEAWPHVGDAILRDKQLAIGPGLEYTNVFPLLHTGDVQERWKQADPNKRVFLLTRSAFMGQQRNGAAVWSGDVYSSWWALRRQVPAGLNFALSGYPYWTTDIGGYHPLFNGQSGQPAYQELYARWFEYGAFCPVFRTHGHRDPTSCGPTTRSFPRLLAVDRLRYRLLPYVYSLAWKVTSEDYTIQRPLVMDFREDPATWEIGDQFMFGPGAAGEPGADRGRHPAHGLSARRHATGTTSGPEGATEGGADGLRRCAARSHPARRARRVDPAPRPGDRIRRPGHRSHRAARLSRSRCRLHALRRRRRQLSIRTGRARDHPDPLERCHAHPDHWRAPGQLSRNGCRSHFQCGDSFCRPRRGRGCDGLAGQDGPIHWHER